MPRTIYIYYIYDDLVYDDSINAFDWKFERYLSIIGNRLLENFFNETRVCSRPANDLYDFSYRSDGWEGGITRFGIISRPIVIKMAG